MEHSPKHHFSLSLTGFGLSDMFGNVYELAVQVMHYRYCTGILGTVHKGGIYKDDESQDYMFFVKYPYRVYHCK